MKFHQPWYMRHSNRKYSAISVTENKLRIPIGAMFEVLWVVEIYFIYSVKILFAPFIVFSVNTNYPLFKNKNKWLIVSQLSHNLRDSRPWSAVVLADTFSCGAAVAWHVAMALVTTYRDFGGKVHKNEVIKPTQTGFADILKNACRKC